MFVSSKIHQLINLILATTNSANTGQTTSLKNSFLNALNEGLQIPIESLDDSTYTITKDDLFKHLIFTSGATITISKSLPENFECIIEQGGDDALTFQGASGVTLTSIDSLVNSENKYGATYIRRKNFEDVIGLYGNLA